MTSNYQSFNQVLVNPRATPVNGKSHKDYSSSIINDKIYIDGEEIKNIVIETIDISALCIIIYKELGFNINSQRVLTLSEILDNTLPAYVLDKLAIACDQKDVHTIKSIIEEYNICL